MSWSNAWLAGELSANTWAVREQNQAIREQNEETSRQADALEAIAHAKWLEATAPDRAAAREADRQRAEAMEKRNKDFFDDITKRSGQQNLEADLWRRLADRDQQIVTLKARVAELEAKYVTPTASGMTAAEFKQMGFELQRAVERCRAIEAAKAAKSVVAIAPSTPPEYVFGFGVGSFGDGL